MTRPHPLRLGTRASLLAQSQSTAVARELIARNPGLQIETILIKTTGDQITDRPLYDVGGKGLFVKELELALLAGQIDFAVHSCKDMPVTQPLVDESGLVIAAMPRRHDSRDLLVCTSADTIAHLPRAARVGTSSLRRRCQLLHLRKDLEIQPMRGNIDTRIKKLQHGEFDAIVLAVAGVERAGLMQTSFMRPIPLNQILPAAGQGALALQCRTEDTQTRLILAGIDDFDTHRCVDVERAIVAELEGDCRSPIAALAEISGPEMLVRAAVGRPGGELPVSFCAITAQKTDYEKLAPIIRKELLLDRIVPMID